MKDKQKHQVSRVAVMTQVSTKDTMAFIGVLKWRATHAH